MTDDAPRGEVAVPVPDDLPQSEERAYRLGFQTCAELFGTAAAAYSAAIDPGDESPTQPSDSADDGTDDGTCPECGVETLASMGAGADVTPKGRVCPNCEL